MPRALGDVVLCPQVVGEDWRAPLTHGLLHLLGYDHGEEMERREEELWPMSQRSPGLFDSFNFAFEGIIHVLRTQRNMRIHFAVAVVVLVAAIATDVTKLELIALLLAIAFVLIAEMINTAIEGAIDVATSSFDPMAKLAKDIAAGAVLIAAINAVAVGYLVFSGKTATKTARLIDRVRDAPAELTIVAFVLVVIVVIAIKAWTGSGRRSAAGCLRATPRSRSPAGSRSPTSPAPTTASSISTIGFVLAVLVAQTRVESGIHSSLEVALGGLLGALMTLALFQLSSCS